MSKKSVLAASLAMLGMTSIANAAEYEVTVLNLTSGVYFTPVLVAAHSSDVQVFRAGTEATEQLQTLAEGGAVGPLAELLESIGAGVATGDGLVAPSTTETLTLTGEPGDVFSMAAMLLPTNDGFAGLDSVQFPASGSITYRADGYDAGTEGNDEVLGTAEFGVPGFPAPPPVVASGTGTGATGFDLAAEGLVSIHRGVIGDLDPTGGISDINTAVHRWLNPVASVTITRIDNGAQAGGGIVSAVSDLTGTTYSSSALEIFWQPASSTAAAVTEYRVSRDGGLVGAFDGLSFFDSGLSAGTDFNYSVVAIDANGNEGEPTAITVRTNDF